jgi:multidrug efflux pump
MAERQQALAETILRDPAVENVLLHRCGRQQRHAQQRPPAHRLKPLDERDAHARGDRAAGRRRRIEVTGIRLYMQPVPGPDDRDRVSRTQYQFSLEDADPGGAAHVDAALSSAAGVPELADVASDLQDNGLQLREHRPR